MGPAITRTSSFLRRSPTWSSLSSGSWMPRAGLTAADVVQAAADIADERGYQQLTIGLVAARLGIRAPSVYKHVSGLAELQHQLATRAVTELGDGIATAVAGRAGRDAL